ncbi:TIGR04283 family arsenosugar biosynthesis glycosyltransferase [Pseudazoarcus pumilus]|uniref:Glycosyl transferase n=1 Tax=Pseudazoarcus pumilus TaxID=2067960 RepID=A0A2I6S4M3_9RHOO|nr:TIGR04283 family arsenosugar biosynthesis glycosyltransferase [Pseudazoarcus pumilus]AUN94199.1 glycosyl transferase [Pseudazoarcus pumilus]
MRLSVVIPVLNEAERLPALLASLTAMNAQVIVVDGGSADGSADIARAAGVAVFDSPPGRARQMNAGATRATGDALLFLHADTVLPAGADRLIGAALADGRHVWGRFDVLIEGRPAMLRVVAMMMNLRSRASGIATGDQAMFMSRAAFDAAGGFPEQPLMEDIEMSRRLLAQSRPACLRPPARTSGRRWENRGVWHTIALMWRLRWDYWRGVPATQLAQRYK